jgi:pyruvate formate lyase activating enzyme
MTGRIFSIEEFSVYDGPGIRTTVFLKGCPLRCTWCHNPEGQRCEREILRSPNGCIACGSCQAFLTEENGRRVLAEESISHCPMHLIRPSGEDYTAEELCQKLLKNRRILQNGGGVTFSGGEPLMQHAFVLECIRRLKGDLHCAIQTSGFCTEEVFSEALRHADYFLYDLKIIDDDLHRRFTGVSNERILKNYTALATSGVPFVTRIPLIPGVVDTEENLAAIARILQSHGVTYAELLPYNKMAGGKYAMNLRQYEPGFDESVPSNPREELFAAHGIRTKLM